MALINITGIAKKRVLVGKKIVNEFYCDTCLNDSLQELYKFIDILKAVQEKEVDAAIEVIQYACSYAANQKVT